MTTAVAEAPANKPGLIQFDVSEAAIAELRDKYLTLKIDGVNDKKGYADVHEARMVVRSTRAAVEKTRVKLKADALEFGRKVDTEAKRLTALLDPIYDHLDAEQTAIDEAKEKAKREAEEAKRAKLQARLDALREVNCIANSLTVEAMTDEQFKEALDDATAGFEEAKKRKAEQEAELARLAEERKRREAEEAEARRKAEAEAAERRKQEEAALAKERERLAAIEREQAAERTKIEEERRKVEREKARQEAAERARVESERRHAEQQAREKAEAEARAAREKAEREAAEARAKAEREAAEAARIKAEQERPHRERMVAVADAVDAIQVPDGPLSQSVCGVLQDAARRIRTIAKKTA